MKGKTVVIATGAALVLGLSAVAVSKGKSMHDRCKEAFTRMAGQGSSEEVKSHDCGPSSEESETHRGCDPAACRK
jgi:hypothetical protein